MITTIQTRINFPSDKEKTALRKIMARDMRVINRVLGIMQYEEKNIFSRTKYGKWRVTRTSLSQIMLSTRDRHNVKYDLKSEFLKISHCELMECMDNAADMYKSYLQLKDSGQKVSYPVLSQPISRRMNHRLFSIDRTNTVLSIMDSRKSNYTMIIKGNVRTHHDYLDLGIKMHDRLQTYLDIGKPKTLEVFERDGVYYVNFAIEINSPKWIDKPNTPLGVIGIDLGINKTIATVLYSQHGIVERKVFNDNDAKKAYVKVATKIGKLQQLMKLRSITRYISNFKFYRSKINKPNIRAGITLVLDRLYSQQDWRNEAFQLQKILDNLTNKNEYERRLFHRIKELRREGGKKTGNILKRLRKLKHKRQQIKDNMINQLCYQIQQFILTQRDHYQIFICLGDVSGIRKKVRRGNGKKFLRKKVNFWAFHKLSRQLTHNLEKIGMKDRLVTVRENWTSIICYRCNQKGKRPEQDRFICTNPTCGIHINADINGAANIAKRGILYKKLVNFNEMKDWNISPQAIKNSKAKRKSWAVSS